MAWLDFLQERFLTAIGLRPTLLAVLAFAPHMLGPGFLFAQGTNLTGFRQRTWPEQVLWSLALSVPLLLCLIVLGELAFPMRTVALTGLVVGSAGMLWAAVRWLKSIGKSGRPDRLVLFALAIMLLLGIYIVLATVPVESGNRIYESVAAGDWSVRIPLTEMALHQGEPLVNPFYGIDNVTSPLRYYYYWYLLCGAVGSVFHLPARSALSASGVWSAWLLVATAFLLLKYLFRPAGALWRLQALCLLSMPVGCIIGLDVLVQVRHFFHLPLRVLPEMEWWRATSDFSLSFHTAMLYAPHHIAGIAFTFLVFLLLLPPEKIGLLPFGRKESLRHRCLRVAAAGAGAAMIVGCSTYMALFLALACLFVAIERLLTDKDGATLGSMALAGLLALAISTPFLRQVLGGPHAAEAGTSAAPLRWHMRSTELAESAIDMTARALHHALPAPVRAAEYFALLLFYLVLEAGFLGLVVVVRLRMDLRVSHLDFARRAQWAIFAAIALPGLLLSSAALSGSNDLGRHAGLGIRVIAVLWAVPLVAEYLGSRERRREVNGSWWGRVALALVIVGLASQGYQAFLQRFFLYLSNRRITMASDIPFPKGNDSGLYYYDLYHGFQAVREGSIAVKPGRVFSNPASHINSAPMIYQSRESVAPEPGCMTAFGGDAAACRAAFPAIQRLFGGADYVYIHLDADNFQPYLPEAMTVAAFSGLCRQHGAAFAVASDYDPAWKNPESFIWRARVLYATPRVRFLACPE